MVIFQCLFVALFYRTILPFFHSDGKTPVSRHRLKIMANGLRIAVPQFFNILMLILSWPYALAESKFWIILAISSWEKVTKDKRLFVRYWICVGRNLALFIWEQYFQKNELKSSVVSRKLVINLFCTGYALMEQSLSPTDPRSKVWIGWMIACLVPSSTFTFLGIIRSCQTASK